jgi:hypothetical protein
MLANEKITELKDKKSTLSTLWIFAVLNYLDADVLGFFNPGTLTELMTGYAGGMQVTQGFLLVAGILMETAIAMVLLSRILKYRANRWANIIIGIIHTVAVLASMFVGTPDLYYLFFGTIEIVCTLFIVWYAWTWTSAEG